MTDDLARELIATLEALRADLKRREARDLEQAGRIPAGSGARAAGGNGNAFVAVFPNYGRSKGQPIRGATAGDLDYYEAGAERTLGDSGKARFHDNERRLIAAIEAERQRQAGNVDTAAGDGFPDGPPPSDEDVAF